MLVRLGLTHHSIRGWHMLGDSPQFRQTLDLLSRVARYDAAVLIEGETGTGKELAARAIHYDGPRRARPFVPVNCGALPDSLIENELFGHRRGAYTGADSDEPGIVADANGGTLFLDEVDSLSARAQVALLRFLEDQHYRPVGGRSHRQADVRIVAASNCSLSDLVQSERFRPDLLYRLSVMRVRLPPLRERGGDIALLATHFVQRFSTRFQKPALPFSADALAWMNAYHWPGNVRELENVVCQAFLLATGPEIAIPSSAEPPRAQAFEIATYRRAKQQAIVEFEKDFLARVIRSTGGNVSLAARLVQTERRHLGRLLKKHGLDRLIRVAGKPAQ
jgi:DNA-binding NtrC family response regulator